MRRIITSIFFKHLFLSFTILLVDVASVVASGYKGGKTNRIIITIHKKCEKCTTSAGFSRFEV